MRELTRRPDVPTYDDAELILRLATALSGGDLLNSVRWLLAERGAAWSGSVEASQLAPLFHWLNVIGILSESNLLHCDLLKDLLPFEELATKLEPHLKEYEGVFPGIRSRLRHLAELAHEPTESP